MTVKTRFAPSPTGYLHVGGARTALYSWLFAKSQGGEFVLRIEDTDLERNSQEAVDAILEGMKWLGMEWDEGPYFQSKRFDRYNEVIETLLAEDKAYKCYAPKELLEEIRAEQEANKEMPRYDANHPKIVAANAAAKEGGRSRLVTTSASSCNCVCSASAVSARRRHAESSALSAARTSRSSSRA